MAPVHGRAGSTTSTCCAPSEAPLLTRMPSEYIRDFFFTTQPIEACSPTASTTAMLFEMFNGETQLLYSSDYPHQDFDTPSTIDDLVVPLGRGAAEHPRRQRGEALRARGREAARAPPGAVAR